VDPIAAGIVQNVRKFDADILDFVALLATDSIGSYQYSETICTHKINSRRG